MQGLIASYRVYRAPLGGGGEPGGWIARDAGADPGRQVGGVRLLHALLGKMQIPREAHRRGHHQSPLATMRIGDHRLNGCGVCHAVI
jgi:hypothetical protein